MKHGLPDSTVQAICKVFARYPEVEKAVLYGSRAMGTYRRGSDIDLTLYGGSDLTLRVLSRILNEVEELLLPYTFDVSIFQDITDPKVLDHIRRVGNLFYEKSAIPAGV